MHEYPLRHWLSGFSPYGTWLLCFLFVGLQLCTFFVGNVIHNWLHLNQRHVDSSLFMFFTPYGRVFPPCASEVLSQRRLYCLSFLRQCQSIAPPRVLLLLLSFNSAYALIFFIGCVIYFFIKFPYSRILK